MYIPHALHVHSLKYHVTVVTHKICESLFVSCISKIHDFMFYCKVHKY